MDNQDIIKRFEHLWSERKGSVESVWDLIERFVVPLRGDFYSTLSSEHEVDWHRRDVYDSTAVYAAQTLAASMHGNLTSPSKRWFELRFRDKALNADDAAKEWLDDCTDRIYNALAEANFDIEIAEAYLDMVTYGTSCLTEELDGDRLNFSAVPVREIYFEEDHRKRVHRFYRKLQMTPVQMQSQFGDKIPDCVKDKLDNPASSTETMDVIFCIYPRPEAKDIDTGKPVHPLKRPFGYKYLLKTSAELLGEESGYYEMPAFVSRWDKVAGSRWGKSPSTTALADILTLNQVKEATLEAAAKAIDPANLVEETALIGDLNLDRGSLTVVTDINGIRPYESGTKFDVSNMEIGMLTQAIRDYFHLNQLELKESPAMTATEVNVRYELMQRHLGSTFARLKSDLLNPLVQRAFRIMLREGMLIEMPPEVQGADLDVEYSGPLARAQQVDQAIAIQNFLMSTAQIAEVYPEAIDLVDTDKAVRAMALLQGVPAEAMRGEKEIKKMRGEREQQAQQQQAIMQGQAQAETLKSAGQGMAAMGQADPAMIKALGQAVGQ
jgi:hypothetical protein